MRELQRDVRAQALVDETRDDRLVLGDDGARLRFVADALAEKRRVCHEAAVVEAAQYEDVIVEGLAGDEPPSTESHTVLLDDTLDARTVGGGEDRAAHCVVGSRRETHSIGEPKR